jgi:hypothetical protein
MPTLRNVRIDLDRVDRATITAALIFWRDAETRPEELEYLSCEFGEFAALDAQGINRLAAAINGGLPGDELGN